MPHQVRPIDWAALLRKYASPEIPKHVRDDIGNLVAYAKRLLQDNVEMAQDLKGARLTMVALTRATGSVEIPYALIDLLDGNDSMKVEDLKTPYGMLKRFTYVGTTPQRPT